MNFSRFLLHGENEMWQYTLLEAVAWSWRHSAQFSVAYFTKIISLLEAVAWSWRHSAQFSMAYFTKIISLLLHWMSYMLYTSPGRGQSKVARAQDLQGKRKTHSTHTIISISALNVFNNVNFGFSRVTSRRVPSGLFSSAWLRQMSTVKKTGQRRTSRKLTSTGH